MTDDPVLVSKLRPEKAGNSLEDKTATTLDKAARVIAASFDGHCDSKGHRGCEGVKFYCGLEEFDSTNDRQRTQAKEIKGFRERPMMATRGTVELSDSSVRVQVTRPKTAAIVLYWNSTRRTRRANRHPANRPREANEPSGDHQAKMRIYYSLYDGLLDYRAVARAFEKVRRAKGAPGIDGQTISDFQSGLREELNRLVNELRTKTYQPQPVRRVSIPKPDGGERHLGIPTVRDRVVQQALLDILQPIFDPEFHPSSYGYRPKRSCQQAVAKATMFIRRYGLKHVVDMDLSKCFDKLDHGLILSSIRRRVADGSILRLVKMFLVGGAMIDGNWEATELGSPQGGVVSPLIANIYLDAFDQEMKRRGHRIVRYADDILILCRSEAGARNALSVATGILEGELKLTVNRDKTHQTHASQGVKFLGVVIGSMHTRIAPKKLAAFKAKVKQITRRNSPVNLEQVIVDLNPVLRGWGNYFRMANCKKQYAELAGWIRRRLRAKQLALWKKPNRLIRRLRQVGWQGEIQKMRMTSWRTSRSSYASKAIENSYLAELGLNDLASIKTGVLPDVP